MNEIQVIALVAVVAGVAYVINVLRKTPVQRLWDRQERLRRKLLFAEYKVEGLKRDLFAIDEAIDVHRWHEEKKRSKTESGSE